MGIDKLHDFKRSPVGVGAVAIVSMVRSENARSILAFRAQSRAGGAALCGYNARVGTRQGFQARAHRSTAPPFVDRMPCWLGPPRVGCASPRSEPGCIEAALLDQPTPSGQPRLRSTLGVRPLQEPVALGWMWICNVAGGAVLSAVITGVRIAVLMRYCGGAEFEADINDFDDLQSTLIG